MNDDEKWLSPRKIVDYYVDYLIPKGGFEFQLYRAVIDGHIRVGV